MITNICRQCGKTFNTPYPSLARTFCNRQCSAESRRTHSKGELYLYKQAPGHPLLRNGNTRISVHRSVLWDKIGPGPHPCHHCGELVDWTPGERIVKGTLVSDHLDSDKLNNDPGNLVPSCQGCNVRRRRFSTRWVRDDEPHRVEGGRRLRGVLVPCRACGNGFVKTPGRRKQVYCSLPCSHAGFRAGFVPHQSAS